MKKKIMMVLPVMKGGGAERVATLLMNEFHSEGYDVRILLTSSSEDEIIRNGLDVDIPVMFIKDVVNSDLSIDRFKNAKRILISVACRAFELVKKEVPSKLAFLSFMAQYGNEVKALREVLVREPDLSVITFLQPSIPIAVLAGKGLENDIIISERGNPKRLMKHRYGRRFIEKYYTEIKAAVFQTEDAKSMYPSCVQNKGRVILNPIKEGLPEIFMGERTKNIVTFCRLSQQKNLTMLIKAFSLLHKDYPDFRLKIIGDALNEEGLAVKKEILAVMDELNLSGCVELIPFMKNVHEEIVKDYMYVNSSDYEGLSNAMLESMAIGIPVICTDCPIGGARAIIKDSENGMLVSVGNYYELYSTMKMLIEDEELLRRLSLNATTIRKELSLENISKEWMELIKQ